MDPDENDLLYTNTYVPTPELEAEISSQKSNEFRRYYEREKSINEERRLRDSIERMSIRSINLTEETDENNLINTNIFSKKPSSINTTNTTNTTNAINTNNNTNTNRKTREVITYVSIDSRDRDKVIYAKPSNFKIFLGRSFYNVKSIKLASMEFPNTNAVINNKNHNIYWANKEDIELNKINAITNTYPEYSVQLRIGSYISTSLQNEMTSKLATIKRKDRTGDYHYFIVTLDIDTDIVTFTSLILKQLSNNSIQTSENTSIVQVNLTDHGYLNGERVYLQGAKTLAGIPSTTLNTSHKITKINDDIFQFEINIKAAETLQGGGNTVKTGRIAPFKFLFGEKSSTIAQNIGFPLENSSDLIKTYIKSIANLYQATIVTKTPHGINNSNLGSICVISGSGTTPSVNGNRRITQIVSTVSFRILLDDTLLIESLDSGQITFSGKTFDISSITNSELNTVLVSTFGNHNYTINDIGKTVTMYDTTTTPNLDETYTIFNVFDSSSFVIPGSIPEGGSSPPGGSIRDPGLDGYIPRNNPLTTHTVPITGVTLGLSTTTFTCPNHELQVGDSIHFSNFISVPKLFTHKILAIPNSNTIVIDTPISSFIQDDIDLNRAYINTGLTTVSFPYHGFNKIISIQNTSGFPTGQTYGNLILVQTQLSHNYSSSDMVRLANTNCSPDIDGGYNVTVTSSDTFTIPYSFPITSSGNSGITNFHQDFYLYGVNRVGEVNPNDINSRSFTVRDIIDENTFTFYNENGLASKLETGGGNNVYISSLLHGFNGEQTNTKNTLLNRSINLQGENYSFLCCPQLATMMNTGNVKNVFARVTLDQSPGSMVFSYLSNPKIFDTVPLNQLNELEFSMLNYDGSDYEFNDLDYSFTLQITEIVDVTEGFQISSRRGIVDN
jgi:hypothetical protein